VSTAPGLPESRTANATTSITPARMPAVVRTSLNPNSPAQTDLCSFISAIAEVCRPWAAMLI
jgi:hypothetical protein